MNILLRRPVRAGNEWLFVLELQHRRCLTNVVWPFN